VVSLKEKDEQGKIRILAEYQIEELSRPRAAIRKAIFSPDGDMMAIIFDSVARVVSLKERDEEGRLKILAEYQAEVRSFFDINFSPDGKMVVIGDEDGYITVISLVERHEDGKLKVLAKYRVPSRGIIHTANFSSDGNKIIIGCQDGKITVFSLTKEGKLEVLVEHQAGEGGESIYTANFSPDGNKILTGSIGGVTKVFSLTKEGKLEFLVEHQEEGSIIEANFSPDGNMIVITVRPWDAWKGANGVVKVFYLTKEGELKFLAEYQIEGDVVGSNFSQDGNRIMVASKDLVKVFGPKNS
jgi:WD40 repeat protein